MTDEEKQELRAMMLEVSSSVSESMRKQMAAELEYQLKPIHRQLVELQADTSSCLDRLDRLEVDNDDFRKRFDVLDKQVADVKSHLVKLSREQMRDRSRYDELSKRMDGYEKERKA